MNIQEVLRYPGGFTPPDVTVTIEKVFPYKSGVGEFGNWSFQDVQVIGGRLKLKNLPEFPAHRVGQTVTIKAHPSKEHGLQGIKVDHEDYQGKTYDKLIVTGSAKWEFAPPQSQSNGKPKPAQPVVAAAAPQQAVFSEPKPVSESSYRDHVLACAGLARQVSETLNIDDAQATQACFATIVIDCKNRNLLLPAPKVIVRSDDSDPYAGAPTPDETEPADFDDTEVPF